MGAILEAAKTIVSPQSAILLLICAALALIAFWREKLKNEKVAAERLKEAKEDTQLVVETVNEAVTTVSAFKASNEALRSAFDALASAVRETHDKGVEPAPKKRGG